MGVVVPLEERFWSKVEKTEGCWNWTAGKTHDGYGTIQAYGKVRRAHRLSYVMLKGMIPDGMSVDHICHNRACVNPDHLRLATHKQNHENRAGADFDSKSGVRGVYWRADLRKWQGSVKHNQKRHHAGYFADIKDAERAVIDLRNKLFTHNEVDKRAA